MKKYIVAIFGIGFLLYPLTCFSSYVIHLNDGQELVTDRYWEEGDQIKFKRYGGVIGIQKDRVREIEEIEDLPEVKEIPDEKDTPAAQQDAEKGENGETTESGEKEKKLQSLIEKKRILKKQLDAALSRLREASRNKDAGAKKKAREEMRDYSKQIYALTEQAKEMNNGQLPADWWQD